MLGCTPSYDRKSQGDNDKKWPFLYFLSSVCAVALMDTAIVTTLQRQVGNTTQIYQKNSQNH